MTTAAPRTRYGWLRDLPDHRDLAYAAPAPSLAGLPPRVDLRPACPAVYDQGDLGSCTANAIAAAVEFDMLRQRLPAPFTPSRLFVYYNERLIEGTVAVDSGAQLRDGVKAVAKQGACPEPLWPYIPGRFAKRPPARCFTVAAAHRAIEYRRIPRSLDQIRACLASGFPFAFGFSVPASFEGEDVARTGVAQLPQPGEEVLGGHVVLAVGYDDAERRFIVRNSWGPSWGDRGYFTLPYEYLTRSDLSADFWTVATVADGART